MPVDSIAKVLPDSRWIGARLARAILSLRQGTDPEVVARQLYESSSLTLTRSRELVPRLRDEPFTSFLDPRSRTGSAENPVTKLFPAAVTERRFLDKLDTLRATRPTVDYRDERFTGHTLVDFALVEGNQELPINVKNAGTRFESAERLVGLDPNDCAPIPAYKAYDAIEKEPNLLYLIAIDYTLIGRIQDHLITQFDSDEVVVWQLLNDYAGSHIRDAEDHFVYSMVNRHWNTFSAHVQRVPFWVISARKAIRILQTLPRRTPGLGVRAWGTGASAEVNVHICVSDETKPWSEVEQRIVVNGIGDIVQAVNRRRTELVYDPEI